MEFMLASILLLVVGITAGYLLIVKVILPLIQLVKEADRLK